MKDLSRRAMLKLGTAGFAGSALPALACGSQYTGKACDGLCNAAITLRAHQLLSVVCVLGGAKCPSIEWAKAKEVLQRPRRKSGLRCDATNRYLQSTRP